MLSIFKKKDVTTDAEKLEAQHQCVIYNLLDHESVIAANLYKASSPFCNITLMDIRDPILPAECYLWLGVGDRRALHAYYEKSIQVDQLTTILNNSVFVERPKLLMAVMALVVERDNGSPDKIPLFTKWDISAQAFHRSGNEEVERVVQYYNVLDLCHRAYATGSDAADELVSLTVECSEKDLEIFYQKQKHLNKGLANKIRHIACPTKTNGVLPFIQFTTLDSVAYTILRRCMSTKKNFLNQSMGVYGQVIYSNYLFDHSVFKTGTDNVLFIKGA